MQSTFFGRDTIGASYKHILHEIDKFVDKMLCASIGVYRGGRGEGANKREEFNTSLIKRTTKKEQQRCFAKF